MNMAAAAIGNGGTLMKPQLVDTVRGSDLQILSNPEPEVLNDVMDESIANELNEMMVGVVEEGNRLARRLDVSRWPPRPVPLSAVTIPGPTTHGSLVSPRLMIPSTRSPSSMKGSTSARALNSPDARCLLCWRR